ncbi:hypothetical protein [Nitratireductor sp. GCM10026969]|uniref:hypothetical protein n=1 Tax=Nitratireductor sp. GCM10026969 TaxID=3252645 RepID=UPI0036184749
MQTERTSSAEKDDNQDEYRAGFARRRMAVWVVALLLVIATSLAFLVGSFFVY